MNDKLLELLSKYYGNDTSGITFYGPRFSGEGIKGKGYFGLLPNKKGGKSTEISVEDESGEYPLIVPTLTSEELDALLAQQEPSDEVYGKARSWADTRRKMGKSPFAAPDELRMPRPRFDEGGEVNLDDLLQEIESERELESELTPVAVEQPVEPIINLGALHDVKLVTTPVPITSPDFETVRLKQSQKRTAAPAKKAAAPSAAGQSPYYAQAVKLAEKYGLPSDVFVALVSRESRFNPHAQSKVGAYGLTQLMPGTAKELGVNPKDPLQNLEGGARYLKQQLDRFKSIPLALAAYNAGPGNVRKYKGLPPFRETRKYVQNILADAGLSHEMPTTPTRREPARIKLAQANYAEGGEVSAYNPAAIEALAKQIEEEFNG